MTSDLKLRPRGRIAAHVLWDYLVQPVARSEPEVPRRPRGVSEEWLTAVLCKGTPDAKVIGFIIEGGHEGSNVRRALRVMYNEAGTRAGLPRDLYTKSTPTLRTRLGAGVGAAAEGKFLSQLRPEVPTEAPTHYHSGYNRQSGRSFHIFEDLVATKGATFCSRTTHIPLELAEQVVDTLATLHAHFYGAGRPELQQFIPYERWFLAGERSGVRDGHDRAMIEARDVIPDDVYERRDNIWPLAVRVLEIHSREPRTLLHSDVHLGNWYITGEQKMGLADWGCANVGHWSRDVAYALSTILDVDDRRKYEEQLLTRYLARMNELCDLDVPFDVTWLRYRQQFFAALLMWTPTLCPPPTAPEMQPPAMSREMIRRISAAISDLKAFRGRGAN